MSVTAEAAAAPGVRDRLIEAAAAITCESGWAAVTMGKVAARAGFSRQTVYNELGSKPALGQAMVMRELDRFLAAVEEELDSHDDLVEAIRSAADRTLRMAQQNPLLDAVLASAHGVSRGERGSDNELLPFLTTDAAPLISAATVRDRGAAPGAVPRHRARRARGDGRHRLGGAAGAQPRHAAGRRPVPDRRRDRVDRRPGAAPGLSRS